MCGIFGYIGNRQANDVIIQGLKKLEYRGYDSTGLSVILNNEILTIKRKGDVNSLTNVSGINRMNGKIGIGHTRWATHGVADEINAHPHNSNDNCFSIVHNGIIENYFQLKKFAEDKGYKFVSDTDSEIIAALLQLLYNENMISTIEKIAKMLSGAFAIAVISNHTPDTIYCFKNKSPMHIGIGTDEFFISSDIYAFPKNINSYYTLNDGDFAVIKENVKIYDSLGNLIERKNHNISYCENSYNLNGYDHYMIKEIFEQPYVISKTLNEYSSKKSFLSNLKFENVYIIGCGSAYNAGMLGASVLERLCNIRAKCVVSSEYKYGLNLISCNDLLIVISQSGETADTICAARNLKQRVGCKVLSIINVEKSSLEEMSDYVLYTRADKEISVATTKCYFAQVLLLFAIANEFSSDKFILYDDIDVFSKMIAVATKLNVSMCLDKIIDSNIVFFIGKGDDYYIALEAALKLKEVCYINAEAYPSGELKHGSIALIDETTVVIIICTDINYLDKNTSAVKEVASRGAYVLCIVTEDCIELKKYANDVIIIPSYNNYFNKLISIVPLQLIAYHTAKKLDVNVDKPRNLAKSVTVE